MLNDKLFALELHLVHESTVDKNQKAVVGILFQAVKKDTPQLQRISQIANIVANISNPTEFDGTLNLMQLMPIDLNRFFYYEGNY